MNNIKDKKYTITRVSKTEFELDDGRVFPLLIELDEIPTIEELQKILDNSKNLIIGMLENNG